MPKSQAPPRPRPELSRSAISMYIQLATVFRNRIVSGAWQAGDRIPTLDELTEAWGVARATVRQAIGVLEAEGLVTRLRAKGTFVNARPPAQSLHDLATSWGGLIASSGAFKIEVLSDFANMAAPVSADREGEPAKSYRCVRRLFSQDGKPFFVGDVYIDERLRSKIPDHAYVSKGSSLRLVSDIPGVKIAAAYQTLTVGAADMETGNVLQLPINAPVVHADRAGVDDRGRLVVISNGHYRGDVVRVRTKLR